MLNPTAHLPSGRSPIVSGEEEESWAHRDIGTPNTYRGTEGESVCKMDMRQGE